MYTGDPYYINSVKVFWLPLIKKMSLIVKHFHFFYQFSFKRDIFSSNCNFVLLSGKCIYVVYMYAKNTAKLNKGYHVTITVYRILMYSVKLCFFLAFKNFTHASIIFVSFNEYVNKYIITCISWLLHDFSCNELHTPAHVIYAQHEMTLFVFTNCHWPRKFPESQQI